MMPKHAYLIIAHGEEPVLRALLGMLDDERNDVYLHVDGKAKELFRRISSFRMKRGTLFILKNRIPAYWGHVSLVKVEYLLFRAAFSHNPQYAYFHLLSGVDLPIKSQDEIHAFFNARQGAEFVEFWNTDFTHTDLKRKVTKYYFFVKWKKCDNVWLHGTTSFMRNSMLAMQKISLFHRKMEVEFKKGGQWVSLTSDFVRHLLSQEAWVMKRFNRTLCPDEIFIQTVLWNSPFRKNLYNNGLPERASIRKIIWHKGAPTLLKMKNLKELLASHAMFARKFSSKDMEVVEALRLATCSCSPR